MPKNIHTPRSELICGKLDELEDELLKIGATHLLYLCYDVRSMAQRMENKLYEYKQSQREDDDIIALMCGVHSEN